MGDSTLTAREKSRIIKEKSLDYVPDPRGLGYELYHSMLLNGNVVAQIDAESHDSDTYGALLRKCVRVCVSLLFKDITKEDTICQCSGNNLNSCIPVISAFFLGVKQVSIDPVLSFEETKCLLEQVRPRIIFVNSDVVEKITEALEYVGVPCEIVVFGSTEVHTNFDSFLEPLMDENNFRPLPIASNKEPAIISYCSEKRKPLRGICLSHYTLMHQLVNTALCCNFGYRIHLTNFLRERYQPGFTVVMSFASYHWISEILILLCSIVTSSTRIISPKFETDNVWKIIDKHNVSFISCTTVQAMQLYENGKPKSASGKSLGMLLTTGISLSDPVLFELRKLLPRCFFTNAYPEVEVGGFLTMFSFTKPGDIRDQYEKPTSCGKIMPGISCKIVDPITGQILAANQAGQLHYKTDFIMNGFFKGDSLKFISRNGWIKSNNIGFYDERQCIHVLDSYDDVFRYKCWHIVPSSIENVIKQHPAVKNAAVIGIPYYKEEVRRNKPVGIVSLNKGMSSKVRKEDIEEFAKKNLMKQQKLILEVIIVKDIPLTLTGKPDRAQLQQLMLPCN